MRPTFLALGLVLAVSPALAQGDNRLSDSTRATQQLGEINRSLGQQIQTQQQNQNFQWQLDNQRMRQQIDTPQSRGGTPTCPSGSVGC